MAPRSMPLLQEGGTADVAPPRGSVYNGEVDAATLAKANVDASMLRSELTKYAYADKGGRMPDTQPFTAVFEQEMHRVMKFVDYHQNSLEVSAKSLLTDAEVTVEQVSKDKTNGHNNIHALSQKVEDLVESCLELQNFVTKNRSALLVVAQKADTQLKTQCTSLVQSNFKNNINSVLVVVVSDIHATIRSAEKKLNRTVGVGEDDGIWQAPSSFQRSTTKYWVKEEQLTKLLLSCAGEAPLLVYGKKGTLTPKSNRLSGVSEGDKLWKMSTPITSVYFDAPDMSMYKKRLARIEGAQLLRVRWYGPKMPKGDGVLFLELKTHHEKWVTNQSVKERAAVQEKDMKFFLQPVPWSGKEAEEMILRASPTLMGDELAKSANLLFRMHRLVVKHNLRACVRSVYMRAAFQSAKSNDLRLTLDREVIMVDETAQANVPSNSKGWCLSDDEAKQTAKAVLVPYNVFEVKLVGENPMPQGLATLISTGVIEEAPKFSKFLTGAAAFNRVSTLPYWANHPSFSTMFGGPQAQQSEDAQQYTSLLDPCDCYHLFGVDQTGESGLKKGNPIKDFFNPKVGAAGGATVKIAQKKPVRAEPKSFFANERTFIQWVSAALLLLTVATIMMANGSYMHTAALISFSAFLLVLYATFTYFRRIKLLTSGKGYGYIDHFGPCVLAVGVGIGIFIVFWDILGATDILGEAKNGRRLVSFNPRRLLDSDTPTAAMYEDPGYCFRQAISGINTLTYRPNDVIVDSNKNSLLVASTSEILLHPFDGEETSHLVHLHDTELGGLTTVGSRIFALSGGPHVTELLEFAWNPQGALEQQGSWIVTQSATEINGLAFVPNSDGKEGQLYMGFDGSMFSYEVPSPADASLSRLERLNMKVIGLGLGRREDKLSSLYTFEGVTSLLHATHGVLHAWDMETGEFLAEIALPHIDNDLSDEWKGFALERRSIQQKDGTASLRGSQAFSELFVHLTLEEPPQIWTFAVEEVESGWLRLSGMCGYQH